MAVHFGKPGTRKYGGVFRAQLTVCFKKCNQLLAYNAKQFARVPPVTILTGPQIASLTATSLLCQQLLAAKN
jgi:hypothetical protein